MLKTKKFVYRTIFEGNVLFSELEMKEINDLKQLLEQKQINLDFS